MGKIGNRRRTSGFELVPLAFADAGQQTEAVDAVPLLCAVLAPATKLTGRHRLGAGCRRVASEVLKALPQVPDVGSIIGEPERDAAVIAEHDVDVFRGKALQVGQEI